MNRHILLSLSGGLDSAVLCAHLQDMEGTRIEGVFFDYGSKHNAHEGSCAKALAGHYGIKLTTVDLKAVFQHGRSALLAHDDRKIPLSDYNPESMADTVVPGRNLIFAAVLASIAESREAKHIALATHVGDHHLYPDCRPEFSRSMAQTISLSTGGRVGVLMPFAEWSKSDIVARGDVLNVPFGLTRSCYQADKVSCGACGTCVERLEAFTVNGLLDPIPYARMPKP